MSCSALKKNLTACHNWSMMDSDLCHSHRHISPDILKERWFEKYIIGKDRYPLFTIISPFKKDKILNDLKAGVVTLTKEDIKKIPAKECYVDIYLLLIENNFAEFGDHPRLEFLGLWLYVFILTDFEFAERPENHKNRLLDLKRQLENVLILSSGNSMYKFLQHMAGTSKGRTKLTKQLVQIIPPLLDTNAAKEMSWMSYDELDKLRTIYEKELGKDASLTKCLVQRWLPDIKELYNTEKQIQKMKMDQCKEELMMNRWHPERIEKYLDMGIDLEDL